ncbi:MAG: hypothetical protein HWN68_17155 [Desulfobacterales bacterium]|nr:hypothetical protein [Desulfobacterales bacterium]
MPSVIRLNKDDLLLLIQNIRKNELDNLMATVEGLSNDQLRQVIRFAEFLAEEKDKDQI